MRNLILAFIIGLPFFIYCQEFTNIDFSENIITPENGKTALSLTSETSDFKSLYFAELDLLSPNGGEIWHATSTPQIRWNSKNLTEKVIIQYSIDDGSSWAVLDSVDANIKKYEWEIPYNPSTKCKVKISSGTISDVSVSSFTIMENTDKRQKIVVLGSSTAAGAGPSSVEKAWVWLYSDYLKQKDTRFEIVNLAVGGYTTYDILPTGTQIPTGIYEAIDINRNITKAIDLNADGIIINMPSNDANMGYPVNNQIANFHLIVDAAKQANIPVWICSVQPRDFGNNTNALNIQLAMVNALPQEFPDMMIDFWNGLANSLGNDILPQFDSGDGIHLNNAGHKILLQRVINKEIQNKINIDDHIDAIQNSRNYLIDFNFNSTSHLSTGNWNNFSGHSDGSLSELKDDLGIIDNVSIAVIDAFTQSNEVGIILPSGKNIFPTSATEDAFYGDNSNPTAAFALTGLDPDKIYSFEIFASIKDQTDKRETKYIVSGNNSATCLLNASNNTTSMCMISDIVPLPTGTIKLTVSKGENNNNSSGNYYINALRLIEKEPVLPDVLMDCEDGTTNRLSVLNVFSNGPGQSSSDMAIVDNPRPSGINQSKKVIKFTRRTSGNDVASWAGFYSLVVDPDPDFTINKYIHVKVLKPKATGVRFKIEGGNSGTVEKLSTNNYSNIGEWQDMVIDFSEKTGTYPIVGLQPDYENPLVAEGDRIIYFDDIVLNSDPTPFTSANFEIDQESNLNIFPNPTTGQFQFESDNQIKKITIFAIDGRIMLEINNFQKSFNIGDLPDGIYILKIKTIEGKNLMGKILKH
jgi:lysophospholipase L1-like esterase